MTTWSSVLGSSLLLLALSVRAAAPAVYEEVLPAKTKNGVTAKLELDAVKIPLSGSATLTLIVEGLAPLEVEPIPSPTASKAWESAPTGGAEVTSPAEGRARWQQSFRLEPQVPGAVILQLAPLRVRAGPEARDWLEFRWKDVTFEVTTKISNPALKDVRGTSVIEPLDEPPPLPRWPFVLGGAIVGALALVLLARRWTRRQPVTPVDLPPDRWALGRIDEIDRLGLPASGQIERFHRLLSDVLRTFLERRYRLPATQQTTAEFMAKLRQSSALQPAAQELLGDFLQRRDLAKFARAEYSPEECQASSRLARSFVTQAVAAAPPTKPA